LAAAFITEVVMAFMFLFIIMGATDPRAPQGFAPIAIGLGLILYQFAAQRLINKPREAVDCDGYVSL
jgi:aquaporin Z